MEKAMFLKRGGLIVFILLMLAVSDYFMVLNKSVNVDIFYVVLKNVLIPLLVAPALMEQTRLAVFKAARLNWMLAGAIIGGLPSAGMVIASGVDYFLQSGTQKMVAIQGTTIPLAGDAIAPLLFSMLVFWLLLSLLSAFSGLVSSFFFAKTPKKESG
jgi:hypothetical protein